MVWSREVVEGLRSFSQLDASFISDNYRRRTPLYFQINNLLFFQFRGSDVVNLADFSILKVQNLIILSNSEPLNVLKCADFDLTQKRKLHVTTS